MSYEPFAINSEEDAVKAQSRIDVLVAKGELSEAEEQYLASLGTLMLDWEEGRYEIRNLSTSEILHALLEDNGLRQVDLVGPVFSSKGIVSEILSGKRSVTYDHVAKLADFFHVSPAVFYPG